MPSLSALNQQRAKLKPEALKAVLIEFNDSVSRQAEFPSSDNEYRYLAADGSTTTFFSSPKLAPPEYFCSPGHSANGVYSIHINAFFGLDAHIYTDAILQPVHEKNEFGAFCDIVDQHGTLPGRKNVYIGDRGVLFLQQYGICGGMGTVFPLPHKGHTFQRPGRQVRIPGNGIL